MAGTRTDPAARHVIPIAPAPLKCRAKFGAASTTLVRHWPSPVGCGGWLCPEGVCNVDADGECIVVVNAVIPAGLLTPTFSTLGLDVVGPPPPAAEVQRLPGRHGRPRGA